MSHRGRGSHLETPSPTWDAETLRRQLRAEGFETDDELPPVAWFGDTPEMADELAELVRRGKKRATAGLLWKWETDGRPVPRPGDRQLVIDWRGRARAVIEMTEVALVPFDEVNAGFAREEGEGDLSLRHWRQVHWAFFARECERIGRRPEPSMPVLCMRFRRLHPPDPPGDPAPPDGVG